MEIRADLISRAAAVRALASSNGDYLDALERFEKIPTIDAIPMEWMRNICTIPEMETEDKICIDWLIQMWQQEQEAR